VENVKRLLGRLKHENGSWRNGCEDVNCTYLVPGKNQKQAFVKMVMNLQVS
jgi:hypothetical protein